MKTAVKVLIAVVVILIIGGAGLLMLDVDLPQLLGGAVESDVPEYSDTVDLETRSQNTNLVAALMSAGIDDSFVDIDGDRVYVAYALPDGYDADTTQRFVIGAAANASPDSGKIVVTQYEGETANTIWTVQMNDFKSYMLDEITGEALDSKIEKQEL